MSDNLVQTIIETALRFVDCINHKDVDGIVEMLADGHLFVDLDGNEHVFDANSGRTAWSGYFKMAPRYLIHVSHAYAAGDVAVLTGRTTGSHLHLPHEKEFQEHMLIWSARVRDGKLLDWRLWYDNPSNRARLGVPAA